MLRRRRLLRPCHLLRYGRKLPSVRWTGLACCLDQQYLVPGYWDSAGCVAGYICGSNRDADAGAHLCTPCGADGQPCCSDHSCNGCCLSMQKQLTAITADEGVCVGAGLACPNDGGVCSAGACTACGGEGQPCCNAGSPPGFLLIDGACRGSLACNPGTTHTCTQCGGVGQACCSGYVCDPSNPPKGSFGPPCTNGV